MSSETAPPQLLLKAASSRTRWVAGAEAGLPEMLDRALAAALLVLSAPGMLLIASAIRVDSPGPVIFRQVRIGRDRRGGMDRRQTGSATRVRGPERRNGDRRTQDRLGRPFVFYKFRTMRHDARELYPHLYSFDAGEQGPSGLHLQLEHDPRVTRLGRFLRRTSLDELPNFLNVLKGDMALVGPRPEIPDVAKYYEEWQRLKFSVKPGITGKAQVNGRGLLSFQETVRHDVEYVLERSLMTDLRLLLKTVLVTVRGFGAF